MFTQFLIILWRFGLEKYWVGKMFSCLQVCWLTILSSIENFNLQLTFSRKIFFINPLRIIAGSRRWLNVEAHYPKVDLIFASIKGLMTHAILLRTSSTPVWKGNICSSLNNLGVPSTDRRKMFSVLVVKRCSSENEKKILSNSMFNAIVITKFHGVAQVLYKTAARIKCWFLLFWIMKKKVGHKTIFLGYTLTQFKPIGCTINSPFFSSLSMIFLELRWWTSYQISTLLVFQ